MERVREGLRSGAPHMCGDGQQPAEALLPNADCLKNLSPAARARGIIGPGRQRGGTAWRHGTDGKGSGIFQDDGLRRHSRPSSSTGMLASAAGLPRVCALQKCRRRKRCFGPYDGDLPCKRQHRGLAQARFESALKVLGWPNLNEDGTPIKGSGQ